MIQRLGAGTLLFENMPRVAGYAAVVGKKESEGPLGGLFDKVIFDSRGGAPTFEEAESLLQREAASLALEKAGVHAADIDYAFAGDLLNQCVGTSFGLLDFGIPHLGQYGACSTMAQSLAMGAVFTESGAAHRALCVTSSHFCAAQRQYRFPMEYGEVRTPTAQWTVTGAGCCVLAREGGSVGVRAATVGRIRDLQITDANNMGAAMAPAAASTLCAYFDDTGDKPEAYDRIITGDLGYVGSELLLEWCERLGHPMPRARMMDCGLTIYDPAQDSHAGGSGCGCSAVVLSSYILPRLQSGEWRRVLFMATGALLSPTTSQQGETIPGVAHAVVIEGVQ